MMSMFRGIVCALTFLCLTLSALAQVQVEFAPLPEGGDLDYVSDYPRASALVRATRNGQPVVLTVDNTTILETNRPLRPVSVTPEGGYYRVRWRIWRTAFPEAIDHLGTYVVVSDGGSVGIAPGTIMQARFTKIDIEDGNRDPLYVDYDFGQIPAGVEQARTIRILMIRGLPDPVTGQEQRIPVESIRFSSPAYRYEWFGNVADQRPPPPGAYVPGLNYRITMFYTPPSTAPATDTMTITYGGGMERRLLIHSNRTSQPRPKTLTLLTPNGGNVFAPCQMVDVTWTGTVKGFPTYVELSTNNGRSWLLVDSTMDTTYQWKVPSTITDSARLRVLQRFGTTPIRYPIGEQAPATNAAFSSDDQYLAIAYQNGRIIEFDMANLGIANTYQRQGSGGIVVALSYDVGSRDLLAVVRRPGLGETLQRFSGGVSGPTATVSLPAGFSTNDMGLDLEGQALYIWPSLGNEVLVYDPATLTAQAPLMVTVPVTAGTIVNDELAVTQLDGVVVRYRIPERTEVGRLQTGLASLQAPFIRKMALGRTKQFLALAGAADVYSSSPRGQYTFVYDLQNGTLYDILRAGGESEVANTKFSASDAYLINIFDYGGSLIIQDITTRQSGPPLSGTAHGDAVTDLEFTNDGRTYISVSADPRASTSGMSNAIIRSFATAESDTTDASFRIVQPVLSTPDVVLRTMLVGTTLDTTLTAEICNVGEVPWIVESATLRQGTWLEFVTPIDNDTVLPGACLRVVLRARSYDVGMMTDTIRFEACTVATQVAVRMDVLDRNLAFEAAGTDFGDLCVGQSTTRTLLVIRNRDSVAVTINTMVAEGGLSSQFRVITVVRDTVLPPGGTLSVGIAFTPTRTGPDTGSILVGYAGSFSARKPFLVYGRGTGVDITASHTALPFLATDSERRLVIRNITAYPADVTSATVSAGSPFAVSTPLPNTIAPGDSLEIVVAYAGGPIPAGATLTVTYAPCGANTVVPLVAYRGNTALSLPTVTADPRGDAVIPVAATITESVPYGGRRSFTGSIVVHPRLFLARSIVSDAGEAEILSQDIIGDQRHIRFRITGDFGVRTLLATITGWAGLAEVDDSPLTFDRDEDAFGADVGMSYTDGLLRIVNPDPERRIVDRSVVLITAVAPNPVVDRATVTVDVLRGNEAFTIRVVDERGRDVLPPSVERRTGGRQDVTVDVSALGAGTYRLVIVPTSGPSVSTTLVVL